MTELTTVDKVKTYLGITGTAYDDQIESLIIGISAQVEAFCGRKFEQDTFTEYFDTDREKRIFVKNYPVQSLTGVKYQTGIWSNITWVDFNANDYLLNGDLGKVAFACALPRAEKFLQITYVGGYLIDWDHENDPNLHTLPADLTQLVTEMVASRKTTAKTDGISNMSTEGQSITFDTSSSRDISQSYKNKLSIYISYNV